MDVCVVFVVRTVLWNVKWHEGRKDLNSTKMDQRGKTLERQKKKIPVGGEIFRSRSDRPWDPPSLLYNGYRVSFPEVKRPGRGGDHPPSSSARVKERVELYLYSPSGPSWPVLRRTLPFTAGRTTPITFALLLLLLVNYTSYYLLILSTRSKHNHNMLFFFSTWDDSYI
jgi:hypothetical protein